MDKKFHKQYLEWKKDSKKGKTSYLITNALITGLYATAFFAIALGLLNLFSGSGVIGKIDVWKMVAFSAVFFVVFTGALWAIYFYAWKKNIEKFAPYEKLLQEKLQEKLAKGALSSEVAAETDDGQFEQDRQVLEEGDPEEEDDSNGDPEQL